MRDCIFVAAITMKACTREITNESSGRGNGKTDSQWGTKGALANNQLVPVLYSRRAMVRGRKYPGKTNPVRTIVVLVQP